MRGVGDRIGKEDISIKRLPCRRRQQRNLPVTGYLPMLLPLSSYSPEKRRPTLSHVSLSIIPRGIFEIEEENRGFEGSRSIVFLSFFIPPPKYIGGLSLRFRKTRASKREAFDVFLKRCQKRNRLNISILSTGADARQSSCQFFQRTNIRPDVFDKGWLIHPD